MRTRTWIIIGAVIVSLAVFVFGKEAVSYLTGATREHTRRVIKDRIPTELEISRLKSMLAKLDSTIEAPRAALVDMQLQAETLEKEIGRRRQNLSVDRAALEEAASLLENRQETYTIGGLTYTCTEVDADARIKAERFRQDTEMLVTRQETLSRFVEAVSNTRDVLSNAEVERQRLGDEIERLEIRAASIKTTSQIASELQAGKDTSLGTAYEGIQKAVTELERRLTKGERLIEVKRTGEVGIDYAKTDTLPSGLDAIREVLQ